MVSDNKTLWILGASISVVVAAATAYYILKEDKTPEANEPTESWK
jgi:hypothetical protein